MNNLSWLIYLASVLPNIGAFLAFIGFLMSAGLLAWCLITWRYNDTVNTRNRICGYTDEKRKYPNFYVLIPVALFLCIISTLIPDKNTIYLIAGSEVGEYVVNTPEAQEILNDVHKIIKLQLKEATNE